MSSRRGGVTSEGDAEEIKPQIIKPRHRILRYPSNKEAAQIHLATFGDLKIANEPSEAGNKSFNQSAKSLGKIHV